MLYSDVGFRAIYNQFCCFEMEGILEKIAKEYLPGNEKANCVLVYGYIDHSAGLSVEVLACGLCSENSKYRFYEPNTSVRTHARIAAVESVHFSVLANDYKLKDLYKDKLSVLSEYQVKNDIEQTRLMTFLDSCRNEYNIDDVLVHIIKPNYKVEACWVRIESLKNHSFIGTLLNEPYQDLGVHNGSLLEFRVEKNTDNKYLCCCYLE